VIARGVLYWILGLAAMAAVFVWAFRPQPLLVDAASVVRGPFEQTVDDDGRTRVRDRYTVSAPLAGRLLRMALKAGDTVEQGALVAVVMPSAPTLQDARTLRELDERAGAAQAAVLRAQAMEERANAALEQARADAGRAAKLAAGGFVSTANLEQAELARRMRDKELDAARFERQAAERELAQARAAVMRVRSDRQGVGMPSAGFEVQSPISGRVLKVVQESEGPVAIGAPLLELGDIGKLEAIVDVLSTDAVDIAPGAKVHIDAGAGRASLAGRVRMIEPSAFTKVSALGVEEQRVNVVIDFVSPREAWQALGDGYRIDARIVMHSTQDAVLVPIGALFRDGAGYAVFVIEDDRARKRAVDVPRRNDRYGLVAGGLKVDERVVVFPPDTARDGALVRAR
jgi:HlyD family secretion protein